MPRRKSLSQFIEDAVKVHGNRYDYSKVNYINGDTPIEIICPVHGSIWQKPRIHLAGHGCPLCDDESKKSLVYGVGTNDLHSRNSEPIYDRWADMLRRCYYPKALRENPTYKGCSVCKEWLIFSNFKRWFVENSIEGYSIDKDILVKGNKVYSPETCCFVPQAINVLILGKRRKSSPYPLGVTYHRWGNCIRYSAQIAGAENHKHLGYFSTPEEAHLAYKEAKEQYVKELAIKYYKDKKISKKVYLALLEYTAE